MALLVMGSPGKIRGELNDDQKQGLLLSAKHYVENAKRFKSRPRTKISLNEYENRKLLITVSTNKTYSTFVAYPEN